MAIRPTRIRPLHQYAVANRIRCDLAIEIVAAFRPPFVLVEASGILASLAEVAAAASAGDPERGQSAGEGVGGAVGAFEDAVDE